MADTRHRTVVEIGVDDRSVRNLGATMGRTFDDKTVRQFEMAIERTSRAMDRMLATATKLDGVLKSVQRSSGASTGGVSGSGGGGGSSSKSASGGAPGGAPGAVNSAALGAAAEVRLTRVLQRVERAGAAAGGGNVVGAALGAVPYIGQALSAALQTMQGLYGEFAASETARSRSYGSTGRNAAPLNGKFARYGFSGGEVPGMLAGMAQQSGLTGEDLTDNAVSTMLAYQMHGGLNNVGSIVGAAGVGAQRGQTGQDPSELMTQAVSSGLISGIRDARLDTYISGMASTLESLRTAGFNLSPSSLLTMAENIANVHGEKGAVRGEAAARLAQSIATNVTQSGRDNPALMRAVGYQQEGSSRQSYDAAATFIETHPEEAVAMLDAQVSHAVAQVGGSAEHQRSMRAAIMRSQGMYGTDIRGRMSMEASFDQSDKTSGNIDAGGMGDIQVNRDRVAYDYMQRRATIEGRPTAAAEAGYRNQREAVGGNAHVAGAVQQVRQLEMNIVAAWAPALAGGAEALLNTVRELYAAFTHGGIPEVTREAQRQLQQNIVPALGAAGQGLIDAAGLDDTVNSAVDMLFGGPGVGAGPKLRGEPAAVPGAVPQPGEVAMPAEGHQASLIRGLLMIEQGASMARRGAENMDSVSEGAATALS